MNHAATATIPEIVLDYLGAVMPYKAPVDKIAALVLLQEHNLYPIEDLQYWTRNECSSEQFAKWESQRVYPIDIGERKYHLARVGGERVLSATDYLVKTYRLPLTAGQRKVLEMINRNNQDGYLKKSNFSVPDLLRKMYELSDEVSDHLDIVSRASHVIASYIAAENGDVVQSEDGLAAALPYEVEQLRSCNNAPLTLGRYVSDLWRRGCAVDEIKERVAFWLNGWREADTRLKAAESEFASMKTVGSEFSIVKRKGLVILTDDRFLSAAAIRSKRYDLVVIVGSGQHTTIWSRRLDLSALAAELQRQEPGRWFYQAETGTIINGKPQYIGVEPTSLRWPSLQMLIGKFPPMNRPK